MDANILRKIKSLLALGDRSRNSSEGECMNALAAAHRLMKEHNISMSAAVENATEKGGAWNFVKDVAIEKNGNLNTWEKLLGSAIGRMLGCEFIISINCVRFNPATNKWTGSRGYFIGDTGDVEVAKALLSYLFGHVREAAKRSDHAASFGEGFAQAVWVRILAMLEEEKRERNANAANVTYSLVLTDKTNWLAAQKAEKLKNLRQMSAVSHSKRPDHASYSSGQAAGRKVDLGIKNRLA